MRARLISAARKLLAEVSYNELTMDAVMERAGVSRGGLYYHFPDRRALFQAVILQINEELIEKVTAVIDPTCSPVKNLESAAAEFLKACADPLITKVLLLEAPAVMGQAEWMEEANALWVDTVKAMLEACKECGADLPGDIKILAEMLIATIDRAGILVARDPDQLPRIKATVTSLLDRIVATAEYQDD